MPWRGKCAMNDNSYIDVMQTLMVGFTYDGSIFHSTINYVLIFLLLIPAFFYRDHYNKNSLIISLLIIGVLSVQVFFWFTPGGMGVSLIWCSLMGYWFVVLCRQKGREKQRFLLIISMFVGSSGIFYYALALPPITTIMHVFGLSLGIMWRLGCERIYSYCKFSCDGEGSSVG